MLASSWNVFVSYLGFYNFILFLKKKKTDIKTDVNLKAKCVKMKNKNLLIPVVVVQSEEAWTYNEKWKVDLWSLS